MAVIASKIISPHVTQLLN